MPKTTKREHTGSDFIDHQKNIDDAINNSEKAEKETNKLEPEQQKKAEYKPGPSVKKGGRTSH